METRHQIFDLQHQNWKIFLGYYGGGMSLRVGLEEFGAFLNFFFLSNLCCNGHRRYFEGSKVSWRSCLESNGNSGDVGL